MLDNIEITSSKENALEAWNDKLLEMNKQLETSEIIKDLDSPITFEKNLGTIGDSEKIDTYNEIENNLDAPIATEKEFISSLNNLGEKLEEKGLSPLSNESKEVLKEKGYFDAIIENIATEEEKDIYEKANLEPKEVNGRAALIKRDIDLNQKDDFGRTNLERMENGSTPYDKDGRYVELHHIGQNMDSPLAELYLNEHRGKDNNTILHHKTESEINRIEFGKEREIYWKSRAEQIKAELNS